MACIGCDRAALCRAGYHVDPDAVGLCIHCGADVFSETELLDLTTFIGGTSMITTARDYDTLPPAQQLVLVASHLRTLTGMPTHATIPQMLDRLTPNLADPGTMNDLTFLYTKAVWCHRNHPASTSQTWCTTCEADILDVCRTRRMLNFFLREDEMRAILRRTFRLPIPYEGSGLVFHQLLTRIHDFLGKERYDEMLKDA